jgi:hypothetical protein
MNSSRLKNHTLINCVCRIIFAMSHSPFSPLKCALESPFEDKSENVNRYVIICTPFQSVRWIQECARIF